MKREFLFSMLLESKKFECVLSTYMSGKMDGYFVLYSCLLVLLCLHELCSAAGSMTCLFCGKEIGLKCFHFSAVLT